MDVAADLPDKRIADLPVELDDEFGRSDPRRPSASSATGSSARYRALIEARGDRRVGDLDEDRARPVHPRSSRSDELEESKAAKPAARTSSRWCADRPGQGAASRPTTPRSCPLGGQGRVLRQAHRRHGARPRRHFAARRAAHRLAPRRPDRPAAPARHRRVQQRSRASRVAVCSLTAAGVGVNLQAASNVVLAELSWTAAEQTQAIDRVHRIGQDEPVTAWRIIAAHTIDTQDRRAHRLEAGPRGARARRQRRRAAARRLGAARRPHAPAAAGARRGALGRRRVRALRGNAIDCRSRYAPTLRPRQPHLFASSTLESSTP